MKTIKSFLIDHDNHDKDFYLSGQNGDILTFDMRFKTPNMGEYLSNKAMHSIEHLFATVVRNGQLQDNVVYFGPMGCRTGFYFLMKDVTFEQAKAYAVNALRQCLQFEELPGNTRKECGNYLEHDIEEAKSEIEAYLKIL